MVLILSVTGSSVVLKQGLTGFLPLCLRANFTYSFITADLHPNCRAAFASVTAGQDRLHTKLVKYKGNMLTQSQKKKLCLKCKPT